MPRIPLRHLLTILLLVVACAPAPDAEEAGVLVCGDVPGETPIQECLVRNLAARDSTVRWVIDTLVAAGLARAELERADARWREEARSRCGPRPDSVPPPPDSARAIWSCYTGEFNTRLAALLDRHPHR